MVVSIKESLGCHTGWFCLGVTMWSNDGVSVVGAIHQNDGAGVDSYIYNYPG